MYPINAAPSPQTQASTNNPGNTRVLIPPLRTNLPASLRAYSLGSQQAHTPYRRALGPAEDLLGVNFDPLAT